MKNTKGTIGEREQTMAGILFYLDRLTDDQLRKVRGFIKGLGYKATESGSKE